LPAPGPLLGLAAALGLAVGGWFFRSNVRLHGFLRKLLETIRSFSQGDLTARIAVPRGREFDAFAQSFNRLADRLAGTIQTLQAGRNQIEAILESMGEGVLVFEPEGRLLLLNGAARRILAIPRPVVPGASVGEVLRDPDLQATIRRTLQGGAGQELELELYGAAPRVLRVRALPCEVSGIGRCALLVFHDITDLKNLEQVRRDFVANVSHEFKTPLTAIRGAVEALLDGAMRDPKAAADFIKGIDEESQRLSRLVEDLLALARLESKPEGLEREPIDLEPFLREQLNRFERSAAEHGVTLRLESVGEPLILLADRRGLTQAVGNLLDNGIKYNRTGGQVIVRAFSAGTGIRIEVSDTGIGMPAADLPRIFERFYRVDKARSRRSGDTGLGLSIVKHMVESHGGSVQVESRLDAGSRFTLVFP